MLAAMRLGGYSATDSDDLRVAVSKKMRARWPRTAPSL